jgi:glycosyltransferase involved in cell wall biosynthesis
MPKVSVVIPTHNRAALLAETVESARAAGGDLEVIVVDDGSTDETAEVCAALEGIRYVRFGRNRGQAEARNAGIREASGEFVAFLDDDDLRLPGTVDGQVRVLEGEPAAALVYGRVLLADARRRLPTGQLNPPRCPQGDVFWELMATNFITTNTVVARRQSLFDAGLFRPGIVGVEDWDLWLRMSERAPFVALEKEAVSVYRMAEASSGQFTSDRVGIFLEMLRVQEMALRLPRARAASRTRRRQVRRRLRELTYDVLVYEAAPLLAEGAKRTAREYLDAALRIAPLRAPAYWWLLRCLFAPNRPPEPRAERYP